MLRHEVLFEIMCANRIRREIAKMKGDRNYAVG